MIRNCMKLMKSQYKYLHLQYSIQYQIKYIWDLLVLEYIVNSEIKWISVVVAPPVIATICVGDCGDHKWCSVWGHLSPLTLRTSSDFLCNILFIELHLPLIFYGKGDLKLIKWQDELEANSERDASFCYRCTAHLRSATNLSFNCN